MANLLRLAGVDQRLVGSVFSGVSDGAEPCIRAAETKSVLAASLPADLQVPNVVVHVAIDADAKALEFEASGDLPDPLRAVVLHDQNEVALFAVHDTSIVSNPSTI